MKLIITLRHLLLSILLIHPNFLSSQSITLECGLSKHFISGHGIYEEPNLHIQVKHNINKQFSYFLSYYTIQTYWPFQWHPITPWIGDEPEIYSRYMYGGDLSISIFPFFEKKDFQVSIAVGPSVRYRTDFYFIQCQNTSGGWSECFGSIENEFDFGISCMLDVDYFLWKDLGISISSVLRGYDKSIPSLSINSGIIYRLSYAQSSGD